MPMSYEEKEAKKVERYLASLSNESEFFGLLGAGYPDSFYKVYVRSTKTAPKWWKFEDRAAPHHTDPQKYQANLKVSGRAVTVWGPLPEIVSFKWKPHNRAIGLLFARATELGKTGP